ncbi:lytic transglycosylase domain-containing protein [Aminobacter sp. MET-1]|uniref:lytic transglycosylase domain-containing protein n=1 Tax=Aminobacter sp. MET-1 TaxID=2951085 RepID=UPI002269929B|nr:lytic transglycosylase domain-containing protein [Aminobacter sp. MET-1]MCX8571126.1 lytic transglycosylase domain-containing protein [Aminobacter sp. MET-1]MCX8573205.1 lytic transglycosylase domain-containing protein [Aminobacter sp. MET-1]
MALLSTAASGFAQPQDYPAVVVSVDPDLAPLSDSAFSQRFGEAASAPRAAAADVPSRRKEAARSSANVFAYADGPIRVEAPRDLSVAKTAAEATEQLVTGSIGGGETEVRQDLIVGIPEEYAGLIVQAARDEGVDPNLMLAIARTENGAFDPQAVSSAGAIGLMQMLPETGQSFGAEDLNDPVQNVRASARFLKVLVDKYANPVLVAAAYNAGEPKVDVRTSMPLIRETADYVTRVVGLYTNAYKAGDIGKVGKPRGGVSASGSRQVSGRGGSRARSSMLVFSANEPVLEGGATEEQAQDPNGPVKIRKEGSL